MKEETAAPDLEKVDCLGYRVSGRGLSGDVEHALNMIASGPRGAYMACANPHSLVLAKHDTSFRLALQQADLLLPDGTGVVMASRILKAPVKEKVAGFDFFYQLSIEAQRLGGMRYFFLGSTNEVLKYIQMRIVTEFPAITVCGVLSPPFTNTFSREDNKMMVEAVNDARPDVLWVGMTAPKQEIWIHQHREELRVPFTGAIGAVFDFFAGTKRRPSRFWQNLGLEWFPRFLKEPRRLWERNLKSTPIFVGWVAREKLRQMLQ